MKLFTGSMLAAGLVFTAAAANAQVLERYRVERPPYVVASDIYSPMAAMPPEAPRYGVALLPAPEVDSIVRESGFSPLGIPRLRGVVYTVPVIDRVGDDGRLVVDARTGRIISFMPANRLRDDMSDDLSLNYGPSGPPPRMSDMEMRPGIEMPRPQATMPHVLASRTPPALVPLPKPSPHAAEAKPLAGKITPPRAQQSAAVQAKPADLPAAPPAAAPPAVEAKPALEAKPAAPLIRPTQPLPDVQGLD